MEESRKDSSFFFHGALHRLLAVQGGSSPRLLLLALLIGVVVLSGCAHRIKPPPHVRGIKKTMEVTGYCSCKKCCGWKRNWYGRKVYASGPYKGQPKKVGITSSGTKARVGTIAADTRHYPYGTVFYTPGYGYGRVEDKGSAIKGEHIDLFFKKHAQALKWGRQKKNVTIWINKRRR